MLSIDKLQEWALAYIDFQSKDELPDEGDSSWWPVWKFYDLGEDNPEDCWNAIQLIIDKTDNEKVLGMLAAGPLEDLIEDHGHKFIERIEAEADRNPKFYKVLSWIWESGSHDIWSRIEKVLRKKDLPK